MDTQENINSSSNRLEFLFRDTPLFRRLKKEQLEAMSRFSKVKKIAEGEILFNHGDEIRNFYFVYSGIIKLFRNSSVGQEKIFEIEGAERTLPEALMFYAQKKFPVSAAVLQESTVISINAHKFLNLIQKSPGTCLLIMGELSRHQIDLINHVDNLSSQKGCNRVATFFLDQSLSKGLKFKLEIPKSAIASMLSLQPETFSRLVKELCGRDVLDINQSDIKILDETKLKKIAGIE